MAQRPVFQKQQQPLTAEQYVMQLEDLARRNRGGFFAQGYDTPTNLPYTPSSGFQAMGQMSPYGFPINPIRPNNNSQLNPIDREQFRDANTGQIYGWLDAQTQIQNTGGSLQDKIYNSQQQPPQQPQNVQQQPQEQQQPNEFGNLIDNGPQNPYPEQSPKRSGDVLGSSTIYGGSSYNPGGMSMKPGAMSMERSYQTGGRGARQDTLYGPSGVGPSAPTIADIQSTDRMNLFAPEDRGGQVLGAYTQAANDYFKNAEDYNKQGTEFGVINNALEGNYKDIQPGDTFDKSTKNSVKNIFAQSQDKYLKDEAARNKKVNADRAKRNVTLAPIQEIIPAKQPNEFQFSVPQAGAGIKQLTDELAVGASNAGNVFRKKLEDLQPFKKIGEVTPTIEAGINAVSQGVKNKTSEFNKTVDGAKSVVKNAFDSLKPGTVLAATGNTNIGKSTNTSSNSGSSKSISTGSNNNSSRVVATNSSGASKSSPTVSYKPAAAGPSAPSVSKPAPKPTPVPTPPKPAPPPNVFAQIYKWLFG